MCGIQFESGAKLHGRFRPLRPACSQQPEIVARLGEPGVDLESGAKLPFGACGVTLHHQQPAVVQVSVRGSGIDLDYLLELDGSRGQISFPLVCDAERVANLPFISGSL